MRRTFRWTHGRSRRTYGPKGIAAMLLVAMLLTGCGGGDDGEPDDGGDPGDGDEAPVDDGGDVSDRDEPPVEPSDELSGAIDTAIRDAAAHFDVDPANIEVTTAEEVTWPDSSLGCPEPDQMYTQALVEGYRILLNVDGRSVAYHGEEGGEPHRCDDPSEPAS